MNKKVGFILIAIGIGFVVFLGLRGKIDIMPSPSTPSEPSEPSEPSKPSEPSGPSEPNADIVKLFLESDKPKLTSYKSKRVLTATSGAGNATLEAWTFLENGVFRYEIISQSGSELIRNRVLIEALETEKASQANAAQNAITEANYTFAVGATKDGLTTIKITPKRQSKFLLNGTITVNAETGDLVRVNGSPSESPSSFIKSVNIVRTYARVGGVRVSTKTTSVADVRFVGKSTLNIAYTYVTINGKSV